MPGFSARDAKRLGRTVKNYERRPRNLPRERGRYPVVSGWSPLPMTLTTGLTAKSGSSPGTGSAQFQTYSGGALGVDTSATYTVYSNFGTAVATGKTIWVTPWNGFLWAIAADC